MGGPDRERSITAYMVRPAKLENCGRVLKAEKNRDYNGVG